MLKSKWKQLLKGIIHYFCISLVIAIASSILFIVILRRELPMTELIASYTISFLVFIFGVIMTAMKLKN